jgi:hypothetical protein
MIFSKNIITLGEYRQAKACINEIEHIIEGHYSLFTLRKRVQLFFYKRWLNKVEIEEGD